MHACMHLLLGALIAESHVALVPALSLQYVKRPQDQLQLAHVSIDPQPPGLGRGDSNVDRDVAVPCRHVRVV